MSMKEGMILEGTVSNVAAFGAFVDLGVHQDGLVHVSQLAHKFVSDAREVVKTGDIVKVQVVEVDIPRKRIALTMKLGEKPKMPNSPSFNNKPHHKAPAAPPMASAMASAFAKLKR